MATGFESGVRNGRYVAMRGPYEGGGQERGLAAEYRAWAQARRFEYPFVGRILDQLGLRTCRCRSLVTPCVVNARLRQAGEDAVRPAPPCVVSRVLHTSRA